MKKNLKTKAQGALAVLENTPERLMRVSAILCVVMLCLVFVVPTAFAAPPATATDPTTAIQTAVKELAINVYKIETYILGPIAAIALGITFMQIVWGSTKAAEKAKDFIPKLIIGIAVVILSPVIIIQMVSWFTLADVENAFNQLAGQH